MGEITNVLVSAYRMGRYRLEGDNVMSKTVRDILFKNMNGCSDHNCIIKKPIGMGTNGGCKCIINMSRSNLMLLASRLNTILDKESKDE